jgi:ArsR family transcriptional regulator
MRKRRSPQQDKRCCISAVVDTRFIRALCDPNRIALLNRLAACGRACSVSELSACCPTDFSVASRHLAVLRDAGILAAEKCGREVRYTIRFDEVIARFRAMADAMEACCPPERRRERKNRHEHSVRSS